MSHPVASPIAFEAARRGPLYWLASACAKGPLRRCQSVGRNVTVLGRVLVVGEGEIRIGSHVVLDGRLAPIELHAERNAILSIGDYSHLSGGTSIEAMVRVEIGPRTRFGGFSKVLDSNFHPVSGNRHTEAPTPPAPVFIGADCEIGFRSIILPGGQLGDRVKVLGNSVVSRKIPPGNVVGGVPLRRIAPTPVGSS